VTRPSFLPEPFGTLDDHFAEIAVPPPVTDFAPRTPFAIATCILAALALGALLGLALAKYRKRRHRREARATLASLRAAYAAGGEGRAKAIAAVPAVVKRCALGSFPRERVAALSGDAWTAFLAASSGDARWRGAAGNALTTVVQRGPDALADATVLFDAADAWIRRHRAGV
jgi:hypothetical protein